MLERLWNIIKNPHNRSSTHKIWKKIYERARTYQKNQKIKFSKKPL